MRALPLLLLVAACSAATPASYGAQCTSRGGLPDVRCTPGETDPRVTQQNLRSTICRSGYSASVRPPQEVTYRIKVRLTRAYGIGDRPFSGIELDHLIPLSLGGASTEANLWPQLRTGPDNVDDKDTIAQVLNRRVCRGQETLVDAQHAIATNWKTAG